MKRHAFTLIELLIVISIIGILAALLFVAGQSSRQSILTRGVYADFGRFETAIKEFKVLHKREPYFLNELSIDDMPRDKAGSYLDPWDTPYVLITGVPFSALPDPVTMSQAQQFRMGIMPYTVGSKWPRWSPSWTTPHQIISAGPDRKFGPGGEYTPGQGAWATGQPGADDLTNWRDKALGVP